MQSPWLAHEAFPEGSEGIALTELCVWLAVVQRRAALLRAQNIRVLDEPPYLFEHLGLLLGRLATLAPVSDTLAALFLVPPCQQVHVVESLSRDTTLSVAAIARMRSQDLFFHYYVRTAARLHQPRRFRRLAENEIERLRKEHEVCCCHWKWDRYAGWTPAYPGKIHQGYYLCPYEYAVQTLADSWLNFYPEGMRRRAVIQEKMIYAYESLEWVELGLAEYVKVPAAVAPVVDEFSNYRLPSLTLPDDVDEAWDAVIAHRVATHCEALSLWLASITPETPPWREELPGNVNVFVADDAAWISSWKPVPGSSITDPERRWREGGHMRPHGTLAQRWPSVAIAK